MGRNSAGMVSLSPTPCSVARGSGTLGAALPQSPWQEEGGDGDTGKILLLPPVFGHATAGPDLRTQLPWCGLWGEKHREPITAKMLWRTPLLSPPPKGLHAQSQMRDAHGYKALPMATGSREPDFGSQSTNEQHSQMKGPTNVHLPDSFPLWGAGQEQRVPVHGVLCLVPELKLNQVCHQGQPERRWVMGCGCCRAKGASPAGGDAGWGCGEGLGHGMSSHL